MFESHHVSRHFERRCKQTNRKARRKPLPLHANRRRAKVIKRLPKLSLAVHAASHLILAARASTGGGSDHKHFGPLLSKAQTRMTLEVALADAGYDSEANHCLARQDLKIRSLIPATIGRPGTAPLKGHYRRLMQRRLQAGPDKKCYGQRWQAETVNSMLKRNLGSACRSRTPRGRKKDMLLRTITHNVMIVANL
jgi:hypothetical protein